MNKVKEMLSALVKMILRFLLVRKNIAIRFVFTLVFMAVWGVASLFIFFLTLFQFAWLFLTTRQSLSILSLSHKFTVYTYRILRFISLNEVARPWPFGAFPEEMDAPEAVDLSVTLPDEPAAETAKASETVSTADSASAETAKPETVSTVQNENVSEEDIKEAAIILDYKEEKK
ncbi:MAG: DUF4389 domain-containing protein [Desulfobacterales bacterium]